MNLDDLGLRIRRRREVRGLKQSDLAHALQVSAQAVSKWERGENAPDIAALVDLARLLEVSTDWLLGGDRPASDTFPATVFCTDVSGFAERARSLAPRDLAAWANGVFHLITEAVLRYEGVPVKYVGDGFLGFFSGPGHADRALAAALHVKTVLPAERIGVTVHSGPIYLGAIGHRDYARPDIMGETVNTAFLLLPWVARHHATGVGVSADAVALLGRKPSLRRARPVEVRGLAAPVRVFEPVLK